MNNSLTQLKPGSGKLLPPPFTPYDYQAPIIKKMIDAIINGKDGLIIQPTATGKSVESAFVSRACALLHGKRGLYLYDENEGLNQARLKFEEIYNKNNITCANFFGYGKEDHVETADMVFASFQSLNNHHKKSYLRFAQDHFGYIIVNEGHHAQAITYKEVIDYFLCPKIGMTATPIRMDGKDILEIFKEVLHEILLEEAITKGYVAQIEYHILSHNLSTQKLKKICQDVVEEGKRISIKQLNESIFVEMLDEEMLKEVYKYAFPEGLKPRQTLIFCENIFHAEHVLGLLQKDGMSVEVVHSRRSKGHNRNSMKHFRVSKIQFLISVDKLNEDIDVPNVELGVFLRATDSLTVFLQQLGRLLRKTLTKNKAIVLDFVANCERLIMVQEMVGKVADFVEDMNGVPLERSPLHVSGEGFDFTFTDDMVDVLRLIEGVRKGFYPTWEEASIAALSLGIKSSSEYLVKKRYWENPRLPANPCNHYSNFPDWPTFLKYKMPQIGWKNAFDLAKEFNTTIATLEKFRASFFANEFEKVEHCYIGGGRWGNYYHPDLAEKLKLEFKARSFAPEGWLTSNMFGDGRSKKVKKFVDQYRVPHPEWFHFYKSYNWYIEHYHPELVSLIKKSFGEKLEQKEGWASLREVAELTGKTKGVVLRAINTLRQDNHFQISSLATRGVPTEQYHPDLVEKIRVQFVKEEIAPEGWKAPSSLKREEDLIVAFEAIKMFTEQFRITHPEWFRDYYVAGPIKYTEHYHPDLVEKIYEEFGSKKRTKAPEGWLTPSQLEKQRVVIAKAITIRNYSEQFRNQHSDWFKIFWLESGFFEHYHPDLVQKIKDEFLSREIASDDWLTVKALRDMLGKKEHKIRNYSEQFKENHPEWFKNYITQKGNRYVEHYHPDLIQKVKEHFAKNK